MKSFNKVENRQNEGNAIWWLFQLYAYKSRKIRNDTGHIRVMKSSNARSSLGYCKFNGKNLIAEITLSPWTVLDYWKIQSDKDAFNQVVHTTVHEICHGIQYKRYWNHATKRCDAKPHGVEWKNLMREFGIFDAAASGGREFPALFLDTDFHKDSWELFQMWRHGESYDKELWDLCMDAAV